MPERLTIGTKKAFENDYAYPHSRKHMVPIPFMLALKAASGLAQMKFWCCDMRAGLGLPMLVP